MDFFTKRRFTLSVIILLVILNLVSLGALWYFQLRKTNLPPPPFGERRPEAVESFLKRELDLTPQQAEQFKEMFRRHVEQTRILQQQIHQNKKAIMEQVFSSEPDTSKMQQLSGKIGTLESRLEILHYTHFLNLKSILQPGQKKKFESLIQDVLERTRPIGPPFSGEGPPGLRRPPFRNRPPQR